MPTYVYGCNTCGHEFEKMQKFQDAPLRECPQCGAPVRRIIQPAGIVFKGSGWYSKDSRAGATNGAKGEESAAKAAEPTSDGKGDAAASGETKDVAKKESTKTDTAKAPSTAKAAD